MRDWLALIVVILIVGILIDGVRRMRLAKNGALKMSRTAEQADDKLEPESYSSEFPGGKARVAKQRDSDSAKALNESVKQKFEAGKVTLGAPQRIPEQVTLNLEESVPMLMDSIEMGDQKDLDDEAHVEPSLGSVENIDEVDERSPSETSIEKRDTEKSESNEVSESNYIEPEEVLIINLMAKKDCFFEGNDLLAALTKQNLKLGAMEIFHRHIDEEGEGAVLYSLANMVVPGTFKLAEMDSFKTPGVSIFLSLPVEAESIDVYDDMIKTAKSLAEDLDGELKDENRSVMTNQTVEHGRQRVIEYERKKKLAKA